MLLQGSDLLILVRIVPKEAVQQAKEPRCREVAHIVEREPDARAMVRRVCGETDACRGDAYEAVREREPSRRCGEVARHRYSGVGELCSATDVESPDTERFPSAPNGRAGEGLENLGLLLARDPQPKTTRRAVAKELAFVANDRRAILVEKAREQAFSKLDLVAAMEDGHRV
jgi:hypothetical protein